MVFYQHLNLFLIDLSHPNFLTALYTDDNILNYCGDSGDTLFSCNEMNILSIDLNNINLDDTNYDEDDSETIIHIRLLAWHSKVLQKELMLMRHFVPKYIRKYLKQFSTWIIDVQKSLWILSSKCAHVLVWIIYIRNIRTTWPIKLYIKSWYSSKIFIN